MTACCDVDVTVFGHPSAACKATYMPRAEVAIRHTRMLAKARGALVYSLTADQAETLTSNLAPGETAAQWMALAKAPCTCPPRRPCLRSDTCTPAPGTAAARARAAARAAYQRDKEARTGLTAALTAITTPPGAVTVTMTPDDATARAATATIRTLAAQLQNRQATRG